MGALPLAKAFGGQDYPGRRVLPGLPATMALQRTRTVTSPTGVWSKS